MKQKFHLDESDLKKAIAQYVEREKGVKITSIMIYYNKNEGNDPRESSYHYAEVSE